MMPTVGDFDSVLRRSALIYGSVLLVVGLHDEECRGAVVTISLSNGV